MGAAALARDVEGGERGPAEILVEHAGAAVADDVERSGDGVSRDRNARGERLEQHQAEGVGAAGKDENVGPRIEARKGRADRAAREVRAPAPPAALLQRRTR